MDQKSVVGIRSRMSAVGIALLTVAALYGPGSPLCVRAAAQGSPAHAAGQLTAPAAGSTELHRAARTGNLALLRSQLQQGANPNSEDSHGRTPLMNAVITGQTRAVKVLLQSGADPNAHGPSGRTALMEAAEQGRATAAKILIQHGADVNAISRTGTALDAAERNGHTALATLLRQSGARSSGHSVGDTVCVRPWGGDGYCGIVEFTSRNDFRLRVTKLIGCKNGCPAKQECSAGRSVGGPEGVAVGDEVATKSWCLTHTGVQQ